MYSRYKITVSMTKRHAYLISQIIQSGAQFCLNIFICMSSLHVSGIQDILCVLLPSYVYLLYYVCIAVFPVDTELMARSQYPEGPANGHLDTGFPWFPSVYNQMLRRLPTFQVATTCFLCSPPDFNLLVTNSIFCIHVK